MELRQLEYFIAVVREGSFSAAAARCHVSQPSLSQGIMNLEDELGARFLVRGARRSELTDAGRTLYPQASALLGQAEEIRQSFRRREELTQGRIVIGAIPTIAPFVLPSVLKGFHEAFPGVTVTVREAVTSNLVDGVAQETIDLAIVSDLPSGLLKKRKLIGRVLRHEKLKLLVPKVHILAPLKHIRVDQIPTAELILLTEEHCLRERTLTICSDANSAGAGLECAQLPTLFGLVRVGQGVAIIPEQSLSLLDPRDVAVLSFEQPEPTRIVQVIKRDARNASPAAPVFEEFLSKSISAP